MRRSLVVGEGGVKGSGLSRKNRLLRTTYFLYFCIIGAEIYRGADGAGELRGVNKQLIFKYNDKNVAIRTHYDQS